MRRNTSYNRNSNNYNKNNDRNNEENEPNGSGTNNRNKQPYVKSNNVSTQGQVRTSYNNQYYKNNSNGSNGLNNSNNSNNSNNLNNQNKSNPMNKNRQILNRNKFNTDIKNSNSTIEDFQIKSQIINYIYRTIELSRFKYKLIEYEYDLPLLKDKKYYVSPNYNGISGLLVFIKLQDNYYSIIVDRRTLNYNQSQVDIENVKMIPINVRLEESIYLGTIMDGVLLYNNAGGVKNYVITDIYYMTGKNITNDNISNKIMNISAYLELNFKDDTVLNNINFIINKLHNLKDIQQLINNYIPKSKYCNNIKGISFLPETSGTKLIYLYNNCSVNEEEHLSPTQQGTVSVQKPVIVRQHNVKIDNKSITAIFRMKKTSTVDVYGLYLGVKTEENNKKLFKYKKLEKVEKLIGNIE
jgi:hypothetical protein